MTNLTTQAETTNSATTMKILTTITEKKSVEKEITIPYYFKRDEYLYKIVSNKHYIRVEMDKDWWSAGVRPLTQAIHEDIAKGVEITSDEFNYGLEKAIDCVNAMNQDDDLPKEADENVQIDEIIENRRRAS